MFGNLNAEMGRKKLRQFRAQRKEAISKINRRLSLRIKRSEVRILSGTPTKKALEIGISGLFACPQDRDSHLGK